MSDPYHKDDKDPIKLTIIDEPELPKTDKCGAEHKAPTNTVRISPKRIEHINEDGIEKKRCCECKIYQPLSNYNNCKKTWDKLRPTCKPCLSKHRAENKEKMTEYNKKYWEKTKDKQTEKSKKWREANKEYVKQKNKEWVTQNAEYKKQKDKEYREAHIEKYKKSHNAWCKRNYHKLKTDPDKIEKFQHLRLKKNISRRIREMLKQDKSLVSEKYLGCPIDTLKSHLESLFTEGMNWENYGKWHIDHIIPCKAFNFKDPLEQQACFHYKNLQPLWAADNISKHDSYEEANKTAYMESYLRIYNKT